MAKSEKQRKIEELKKALWAEVEKDVQEALENDVEPEDIRDWDNVTEMLYNRSEEFAAATGNSHRDYSGKLVVTPSDRKKILEEVEGSCLSEKAKESFKALLQG